MYFPVFLFVKESTALISSQEACCKHQELILNNVVHYLLDEHVNGTYHIER